MTIETVSRRAGPFTGDGSTTSFPFEFKVFSESQISVQSAEGNETETTLTLGEDYSVTLNSDQDENPGGTVTLASALATDTRLSIISAIPSTQLVKVTNYDRFYPTTFNDEFDKLTGLIQQLEERADRAITVDSTSAMTGEELKQKLLTAADSAFEVATKQAAAAKASAEEAKTYHDEILNHKDDIKAEVTAEGNKQVARVTAEGDTQDARVVTEGDTQVARIQAETDNTLIANGVGGGEKAWTLSEAVAAGTAITIPGGLKYIVNRHHLRVSYNGVVCYIGTNFTEVGDQDTYSTDFKLTFDAQAGDELDVWVGALGKGEVNDAITLAGTAVSAVADLSRKVVYKEEVTE